MNDAQRKEQQQHDPEVAAQFAEMLEGARNCFLLYQSFIEAGFTEGQAIQLVGVTLGGQR